MADPIQVDSEQKVSHVRQSLVSVMPAADRGHIGGAQLPSAMITAYDGQRGASTTVYTGAAGSFGANPLRQTIGLWSAARVERLEVFWPTTGETQAFTDVPVDRLIRIVEGESSYSTLDLKTLKLAGGDAAAAAAN